MDSNPICHPSPAQKEWNAHFWITFNFWWSAGLINGLEPHPPPLSSQKNEMLVFVLYSLLMIGWAGQWTWTPSTTPLQPKKKNEMLVFGLHSTSDDQLGWSMDSNPIGYPSPTKNWNAHFWITFKFWSAGLVDGLELHLPPLSSQKKWNVHFWITFNFWWSAGLVDGLEPHPPPLSNQKNEMLIFGLHSTSDDWPCWWMDSNPICHPSPAKKNEMFIFGLHSTSDDWLGWLMDSNPICHLSPA